MTPTTSPLANGQPTKHQPTGATTADPRPELRRLTPQEALGLPSGSGLLIPFLYATAGAAVLLMALTIVPYLVDQARQRAAAAEAETEKAKPPETPEGKTPVAPEAGSPATKTSPKLPATGSPKTPGKGDILDKLGENGSKTVSPKVNPLDKKEDDILKDIK